ncbi:MAG: hypothetical protein ABW034_20025 [Steroidobacteraceae bacterium]
MNHSAATILLLAATILQPAIAAERLARLTVEVKVTGQEQWRNAQGTDNAKVRIAQTVSYSTVVKTDGEIVDFNSKDPSYYQQQMSKAGQVTRAKNKAPMTEAELKSRVQKGQEACKGDQQCLYGLAMKASEWTSEMTAANAAPAPLSAGSGSYLNYLGFPDCGSKIHITVHDATEGAFADVQGPVPFSVKTTADYTGDDHERLILCSQTNLVVDPKQKVFYSDGLLVRGVKGSSTRTQRGKSTQSQGDVPLKGEAFNWASEQLRKAPLSGTRKTVLKITNSQGSSVPFATAKGDGTATVEMSWRFEEI